MTTGRTSDLWWKNAVVYCLDVETFHDWNGDGRGDLTGLTERIDYLAGIGVSCLWLMPFQPSPNRDDGYDITDYYAVDPRLGTLGDFVALIRTAKDRGMRVIIDLVVNHTSDQHPWFKAARSDPQSPFRDYYVWADEPPEADTSDKVVFPDQEDSIWTKDAKSGKWYLHNFYKHQPELNIANPAVRDEIAKIAGFWLQLGVDGFRVDAVPFLVDPRHSQSAAAAGLDPHEILRDLRAFISRRKGDAVLLGEVNLPAKGLRKFFGDEDADEVHMLFDFPLMQQLYLALARRDTRPLRKVLEQRPPIPEESQWAIFVRNHDELTLDQLTEKQRDEVFAAFGPDEDMQLFGRGLRRRLPPMLQGDEARVRMVYSLLFSLPGTPVLFYGEEIGMGENLAIPGRLSVRTPMQWSADPGAGFSSAPARKYVRPLPSGEFGPLAVNVADQRRDQSSMLNWMERVIRRRRETPEIGWGTFTLLDTGGARSVLAHRCDWESSAVVALHNFDAAPVQVQVDLGDVDGVAEVVDLLDGSIPVQPLEGDVLDLALEGYGHRWFRLRGPGDEEPAVSRAARRKALLERATSRGAAGVVLRTFADIAWYTGGVDVRIDRSVPTGSTVVLVATAGEWVITDVIEGPRLRDEEPALRDLEIVEHPWTATPDQQVRELAEGGLVLEAGDVGIDDLRMVLDDEAIDRYRTLGRDLTDAFDEVEASVTPDDHELEVAGRIAAAAWAVGAHAPVLLVAGADRIPRYRHPLPTPAALGDRVMFVACFERGGLFASSTRYVHFAEPDAELTRRLAATDEILRRTREDSTQPGRTLGEAFAAIQRFYAEAGFPDEWQLHHQGGIAGYQSREVIGKPDDPTVLRAGMAFAWNPSITGAKSEETFVLLEGGSTEVLA